MSPEEAAEFNSVVTTTNDLLTREPQTRSEEAMVEIAFFNATVQQDAIDSIKNYNTNRPAGSPPFEDLSVEAQQQIFQAALAESASEREALLKKHFNDADTIEKVELLNEVNDTFGGVVNDDSNGYVAFTKDGQVYVFERDASGEVRVPKELEGSLSAGDATGIEYTNGPTSSPEVYGDTGAEGVYNPNDNPY